MALPTSAHPGLFLGSISSYSSGPGTHVNSNGSSICASLRGKPSISTSSASKPTISVTRPPSLNSIPSRNITCRNILPSARVTLLQQLQANVSILVVDDFVCADEFAGVVRKEDVRGWETDKIKIDEMYRVGDIVRAVVVIISPNSTALIPLANRSSTDFTG